MKSEIQIRKEISDLRRLLRERKRKSMGLPSSKPATRTVTRRDGHTYVFLVGWRDALMTRAKIYENAGGRVAIVWFPRMEDTEVIDLQAATCQGCTEPHLLGWNEGEWFHNSKTKGGRRCDGTCCALFTCKPFHERWHNRVIAARQIKA